MKCIQNQNGNHVIQKCFETIKSAKLEFIITEVIENVSYIYINSYNSLYNKINNLAFHAYGCRVIQKILEYSDFEKVFMSLYRIIKTLIYYRHYQYWIN